MNISSFYLQKGRGVHKIKYVQYGRMMRVFHMLLLGLLQLTKLFPSLGEDMNDHAACASTTVNGDKPNIFDLCEKYHRDGMPHNKSSSTSEGFECGVFLAASSIPNAGLGIYTTRFIAQDTLVQPYPESPSIIVADFYEATGNSETDWNHIDYMWDSFGISSYEADSVDESVMTFGSLCNYHPVCSNEGDVKLTNLRDFIALVVPYCIEHF